MYASMTKSAMAECKNQHALTHAQHTYAHGAQHVLSEPMAIVVQTQCEYEPARFILRYAIRCDFDL